MKVFLGLLVFLFFLVLSPGTTFAASLFYDSYESAQINSTKWDIHNSQNKLDQGLGSLRLRGNGSSWNDSAFYTNSTFNWQAGRTFINQVRSSVFWADGPVMHFSPSKFPQEPNKTGFGTMIDSTGGNPLGSRFNAIIPGAEIPYLATSSLNYNPATVKSIDYLTATILRNQGSFHLISGGTFGNYPDATLIWVNDQGQETSLYAGINNKGTYSSISLSRVLDLTGDFSSEYGLAKAVDTFTRADSSDLGSTEKGSFSWSEPMGDVNISNNKLTRSTSSEARAIFDAETSEGIYEITFSTPVSIGFATTYLYFRYQDEDNWWRASCNESGLQLEKNINGSLQSVANDPTILCQPNATYRMIVRAHGESISAYLNNFGISVNDNALSNQTKVGVGFSGEGVSTNIDKIVVWPKKIVLPSGDFPTVPTSASNVILTDNFTTADGTLLSNHTTSSGSAWTTHLQNWSINGGVAKPSGVKSMATTETGLLDMAVSADVTLPKADSGTTEWFSGLVTRFVDSNNYTEARFLWQSGSPEIELWDFVNGVSKPTIYETPGFLNATNITGLQSENSTHNIKLVVVGNQVAAYMDDVLIVQGTTVRTTGTKAGMIIDAGVTTPLSSFDNFKVTTAHLDQVVPSAVTDLSATISRSTYPLLNWSHVQDDTATGVKYYKIFRSTDGSLGTQINQGVQTTTNFYNDYSLTTSGTYYYTIQAVDQAGNTNSSDDNKRVPINFTYTIPAPVSCESSLTGVLPNPPLISTPNLVLNNSFENITNNYPTSWQPRPTASSENSGFNSSKSLKVMGPATQVYSFQKIKLQPNTKYSLTGYVKTQNITTGGGLALRFNQIQPAKTFTSSFIKGTADWQKIDFTFVTSSDYVPNDNDRLDVVWDLASGETGFFDEIKLERLTFPNLVLNPSLEDLTLGYPTNWWKRQTSFSDSSVFYSGGKSVRVEGPAEYVYSQQSLNLQPNTQYSLSFWVKTEDVLAKGLSMRYSQLTPTSVVIQSPWARCTADWQKVTKVFTTPADHQTGRLDIFWQTVGGDKAWIDDVSLCQRECLNP